MSIHTSSSGDQVGRGKNSKNKVNPVHFFFGFLIISFVLAFIVGGYVLGKQKNAEKQNSSTSISEQVKINPLEIPDNPDNWTTYHIKAIGMDLKLPEKLTKLGEWKEYEIPGEKGSLICFSYKNSKNVCNGNVLTIGGSSTDFAQERELRFTDLQGFTDKNGVYFVKSLSNEKVELNNIKFKKFESENGVEIIKILGEKSSTNQQSIGNPGDGYLGAVINTKNSKYPGLTIQMKIDDNLNEYEFDQILKSLKFTN